MTETELHWVAGLLEGEGCFKLRRDITAKNRYGYPNVEVNMTDEDIIHRLHSVVGFGNVYGPLYDKKRPHYSPTWRWIVQAKDDALRIMDLVYPLMGKRRRAKIDEIRESVAVV